MTVNQLIERLEELRQIDHGDDEVRFVYQENYPLQDRIRGVWVSDCEGDDPDVVYIVSGGQCRDNPYGPVDAFAESF